MAQKRKRRLAKRNGFIVKRVPKQRDYAAEYARRIARWISKGFSRSQARGHPKPAELSVSNRNAVPGLRDERLQHALRVLRQDKHIKAAAKAANVSPERLRRTAIANGAIVRRGRRWVVNPKLPRRLLIYSRGKPTTITVGDFDTASLAGRYMSAAGTFLSSNNINVLAPFAGQSVRDISGKQHPLEINPNVLHRLAAAGGESFSSVYRIVI
ncbi:MAG TPA: hypothetical protein VJ728_06210 [Candidatus Binataceae bacterium]|nr:hypothetical protein [Candidatus Binataceae bacterium]